MVKDTRKETEDSPILEEYAVGRRRRVDDGWRDSGGSNNLDPGGA